MQRPPIAPLKNIKRSKAPHAVRAIGIGLAFAGLDYLGYQIHKAYKNLQPADIFQNQTQDNDTAPKPVVKKSEFSRDEILKAIAKKEAEKVGVTEKEALNALDKTSEDHLVASRILENFVFGCVLVKIGKEIRSMFMNNYMTSWKSTNKLLMTYPIPILSYYTFCNFYEGKSTNELATRLQNDFLILYCARIVVGNFEKKAMLQFEKLTKNINTSQQGPGQGKKIDFTQQEIQINQAVKKTTFTRNVVSGAWIFLLTYLYKYPFYDVKSEPISV